MGKRLAEFYEQASRWGVRAKVRLAVTTGVRATDAASFPDSPQLLAQFERVMAEIRREFAPGSPPVIAARDPRAEETPRAVRQDARVRLQIFDELRTARASSNGDVRKTILHITEAAARGMNVARASVWFLENKATSIRCADLYEREARKHSAGLLLHASAYPAYFTALRTERTIAADDARHDPRTSCFSDSYLKPLGIASLLDVPIWTAGGMVGVVCHEHVGEPRTWTRDDEDFAYLLSGFVALDLDRQSRA